MQAGLADHVWEIEELVGVLEADEAKMIENVAMKRGQYRKSKSNRYAALLADKDCC